MTDQLRYDYLGCMGNREVQTPNIDKIAENGVLFKRAYAVNTVCQPTRASLFTGQYPRSHGRRTMGTCLNRHIVTLPEVLSDAGYRTHSVGKLHLGSWCCPEKMEAEDLNIEDYPEHKLLWESGKIKSLPLPYYGFESADFIGGHGHGVYGDYKNWLKENHPEYAKYVSTGCKDNEYRGVFNTYSWPIPEELHYNRWISDRSNAFIENQKNSNNPFFLWCSFPDPHHPYMVPEPWDSMYDPDDVSIGVKREGEEKDLPPYYKEAYENKCILVPSAIENEKGLRQMIATTYGMVSFIDHEIGRIINKLEETGMLENTIIVVLSDHGDMMGDHGVVRKGPFQFNGAIRIPYIWSWGDRFKKGLKTDGIASQIDFVPTIMDLCGIKTHETQKLKFWSNKWEKEAEPPVLPGKSLKQQLEGKTGKTNDFAIVETDADYLELRIRTFITEKYRFTIYPGHEYGELFDIEKDPDEFYNLWDIPEYQDIKNKLYKDFIEEYIKTERAEPKLSHGMKIIGQYSNK
jgi:arylsulfatase A-like enzyme